MPKFVLYRGKHIENEGALMKNHIHILGASGSGTTTLGLELAKKTGYHHFDTDDFYWEQTDIPYTKPRPIEERQKLLRSKLLSKTKWILTGSLTGWGDMFVPEFYLVVFLWIPSDLRIQRLHARERLRYGSQIEYGGEKYKSFIKFIDWASMYDTGDESIRSKKLHESWLKGINCDVLRLEGKFELEKKIQHVITRIKR